MANHEFDGTLDMNEARVVRPWQFPPQDGRIEFDAARFMGARTQHGHTLARFYDDGFGPLWIYRDSGGLMAVVRAMSWETAWEVVEDEILDDADPEDIAEWQASSDHDSVEPPEGIYFRPNGGGDQPWAKTPYAQEDLNGSSLDMLTYQLLGHLGLTLLWESYDHEETAE